MPSFMYKSPRIYDTFIRLLYFDGLKILKRLIGERRSVFEPACGYGRMKRYLDPSCSYSGIDLNKRFIDYARKKELDVQIGNIMDHSKYQQSDVILLADILHHLNIKDMLKLVSIAAGYAKEKIVIIEPVFVHIGSKKNWFSRMIAKFMQFCDDDGYNHIERWLSRDEYNQLFKNIKEQNNIREMKITHHRNHDFVEMYL